MKKIKLFIICIFVFVFALLSSFNTKDNSSKVKASNEIILSIEKNNLSYSSEIYLLYAVSYSGFDVEENEIQLLFWDEIQDEYIKGTEAYYTSSSGSAQINGKACKVFYSEGIAAKELTDDIYARAYVNISGNDYYGDVYKCSVLEYIYRMKENNTLSTELNDLFDSLLEYGANAQKVFKYNLDRLANSTYYKISVENGTLSDSFNQALFQENEEVTINAYESTNDVVFSHWANEDDELVSSNLSYTFNVTKKANYKAIYKVLLENKKEVSYNTNFEDLNLKKSVEFMFNNEYKSLDLVWDSESYDPALVGSQRIYASFVDESVYEIYGFNKEDLYIDIKVSEFEYILDGGEYMLVSYNGSASEVEIPSSYNGINVTSIESNAFKDNTNLQVLILGSNIKNIGDDSFLNCVNLKTIYNNSTLVLEKGSIDYGYIAYYADIIYQVLREINISIDLLKNSLEGETSEYTYTYSNPDYYKITVIISLKEEYLFSDEFVLIFNNKSISKSKYTIIGNKLTYIFTDPNWTDIY